MSKFQAMMAVVFVALLTFAVQSCGNDDKDDNLGTVMYKMTRSLVFSDKGELTTEAAESFQKKIQIGGDCRIPDRQASRKQH